MSNYTNENLINVPSANVPAGTLAMKVGNNVFTAGNVVIGGGATDFYKCASVSTVIETISPQDATSATGTGYSISASTEYSSGYAGWKAFNGESGTDKGWFSSDQDTAPWIQIQFTSAKVIDMYSFGAAHDSSNQTLSAWTLQGSNNGTDWTDLDTQTGQSLAGDTIFSGSFTNSTAYYYYRLSFPSKFGYSYIGIQQMNLMAHNSNLTWTGYKAVLSGGVYSFESTVTSGLTYGSGFTPAVNGIYSADAMISVAQLYTVWEPPAGAVFYAPLDAAAASAETGQTLTANNVTFNVIEGIPCASFEGTPYSYIYTADGTGLPVSGATSTISCWVRFNSLGSGNSWFMAYGRGSLNAMRGLYATSYSRAASGLWGQGGDNISSTIVNIDTWYHFVAIFTDVGQQLYLNGQKVANLNYSEMNTVFEKLSIGGYFTAGGTTLGEYANCCVAAVRVYNRALSASEITTLAAEFTPTQA